MTLNQRIDALVQNLPGDLTKLKAELVRKMRNDMTDIVEALALRARKILQIQKEGGHH